jgi:hypothetical protein
MNNDSSTREPEIQQALDAIVERLEPRKPRAPLKKHAASATLRSSPRDPPAALKDATAALPAAALLATGCIVETPAGLDWAPGLRQPDQPVVLVRGAKSDRVVALVAEGRPAGIPPMATEMLCDHRLRQAIERFDGALVTTSTLAQAVHWIELGLPAIPIGDLTTGQRRQTLARWLWTLPRPGSRENRNLRRRAATLHQLLQQNGRDVFVEQELEALNRQLRLEPVLVAPGWDPAAWTAVESPAAAAILRKLEDRVAPPTETALWRPPIERIEQFRLAAEAGEPTVLVDRLRASLARDLERLGSLSSATAEEQADLRELRRRLSEAPDDMSTTDRRQAEAEYLRAIEKELIEPLESTDGAPVDRLLLSVGASVARQVFAAEAGIFESSDKLAATKQYGQLTTQLMKFIHEIKGTKHAARWPRRR